VFKLCKKVHGDYLKFLSTTDVAMDMEMLRKAVGDSHMNCYGVSYGTLVGQVIS
jgi:pimeloyl-ACP methyl ester carboxylesterase